MGGEPGRGVAETLHNGWGTLKRYRLPDGSTREVYDHGHAVACLTRDPERDTVLLVRQTRVPILVHEDDIAREGAAATEPGASVEAPAGLIDEGETPEGAMRREMREETGYRVHDLRRIADLYASPGSLSERMILFTARYDSGNRVAQGGGVASENEAVEVLEVSLSEALAMVRDSRVRDLKTAYLLQHAALARADDVHNGPEGSRGSGSGGEEGTLRHFGPNPLIALGMRAPGAASTTRAHT